MHKLRIVTEPSTGGDIQGPEIAHHTAVGEECVVDIGAAHVPVGLHGADLHGHQSERVLLHFGVGRGEGVEIAAVVGIYRLWVSAQK